MKNPTHCDIGTCHEPHTGSLVTCDDGIRRALCHEHRKSRTRKRRAKVDSERQAQRVAMAAEYQAKLARWQEAKRLRRALDRLPARVDHEVCACTYHGGRLVRVCRKHGGA